MARRRLGGALHAMAVLQNFQAKLLQAAEGGALTAEAVKDLCTAMDFVLMATKRAAQAVVKAIYDIRVLWSSFRGTFG